MATLKKCFPSLPWSILLFFLPKRKPLFSRLQAKLVNKGLLHTFENSSPEEQQERRGGWSHQSGRAAPVPSGRVRSLALGDSVTTPVCSTVFPLARRGESWCQRSWGVHFFLSWFKRSRAQRSRVSSFFVSCSFFLSHSLNLEADLSKRIHLTSTTFHLLSFHYSGISLKF